MHLTLVITGGSAAGKKLLLRQGQTANIGRTEWADFSVPDDSALAEHHFDVACEANACLLHDPERHGVTLDGKPVSSTEIRNGQRIKAGNTVFEVEIAGAANNSDSCTVNSDDEATLNETVNDEELDQSEKRPLPAKPRTAAGFSELLQLSDEAKSLVKQLPSESPHELLAQLIEKKLHADAIGLSAGLLSNQQAVQWGAECLQAIDQELTERDEAAATAVDQWLAEPNEQNRRENERVAKENDFEGAFSWLAMAAFWSGGSMSPAGQPEVEPLWHLTAKGVVAALTVQATADPATAESTYETFIRLAKDRLTASLAVPA